MLVFWKYSHNGYWAAHTLRKNLNTLFFEETMDPLSAVLLTFGAIVLVASWAQLIIAASGDDFTWGLFAVFLPPLAYLYALFAWDKAGDSIKLAVLGLGLLGLGLI